MVGDVVVVVFWLGCGYGCGGSKDKGCGGGWVWEVIDGGDLNLSWMIVIFWVEL